MQSQQPQASVNQVLFDTFTRIYQNFVELINKMPIDPALKYRLTHDTGSIYLWIKEAMIEAERIAQASAQPKLEVVENNNEGIKDQTCAS